MRCNPIDTSVTRSQAIYWLRFSLVDYVCAHCTSVVRFARLRLAQGNVLSSNYILKCRGIVRTIKMFSKWFEFESRRSQRNVNFSVVHSWCTVAFGPLQISATESFQKYILQDLKGVTPNCNSLKLTVNEEWMPADYIGRARTLGSWVRIQLKEWMSVYADSVFAVLYVGSDLAAGWPLFQWVLSIAYTD
jgi:hypothetical protein